MSSTFRILRSLKGAGGSVRQQKPQRSREATNDSASESVDSQPTKKSRGENDGQDDDRMMISKAEEEEEEGEGRRGHHFNAASDGSANDIIIDGDSRPTGSLTTTANRATGAWGEANSWKMKGGLTKMSSDENSSDLAESAEEQDGLQGKGDKRTQGACCQERPEGRCRAHSPVGGGPCRCRCRVAARSTTASKREFLSQQIDAGLFGRASEFTYSPGAVPMKYQSLHFSNKKIRKSPSDGTNEVVCMTRLVKLMITDDIANSR